MDTDVKKTFEKLDQTLDWLVETLRNGTWARRLLLLDVVVLLFFNSFALSKAISLLPTTNKLKLTEDYDVYYWVTFISLFLIALIITILRPRVPNNPAISALEKNSAIRDLYAFDFDDADIFKQLQRGVILDKVTNALINPVFKFGILYGESGCGKTSFLKAGLCAALKQNGHYQAVYIKFDKAPPETYLHLALQKALELPINSLLDSHDLLTFVLNNNNGKGIVFIFDQFEQFFLHQPQPEQRAPFIQLLASLYQTDRPVKILIGIRRDYFSYAMEIAPEINAEFEHINQKEVFKLPNFTVTEATAVFKVLAQTADLAFDESAVEEICRKELAKQDNLILPADLQILASVIRDLPRQDNHGKLGFNRDTFLKVGGVEGLLNNFLKNNLEILSVNKSKTVLKVLRALIDRSRNLRAGELTLEEIQSKASDISLEDIKDALEWSAGTRLIFTIEEEQLHINKYQLTHEKLIPSVLALVGELSDDVEKANTLLERRTNEWLGNQRLKRFLLNFSELRLIDKQKHSLVWGDNQRDKEALIAASRRRHLTNVAVYAVLPVLAMIGYGLWWLSPQGQIYECESYLNAIVTRVDANDDERKAAVLEALINSDNSLRIKHIYQLEYLQKTIVEKITDEYRKAFVFQALATAAATLGDKTQGLAYLTQLQTATEKITDEERKATVFQALATAAATLGDKTQGLAYLTQLQTATEKITDEEGKATVFQALATAAATLGDPEQALQFSQRAVNVARNSKASDNGAFLNNAELNAQAGNYRTACNLAREGKVKTGEALKILAVVLREYTQKHRL